MLLGRDLPPLVRADQARLLSPVHIGEPASRRILLRRAREDLAVVWDWFTDGRIYPHLWVTLQETALAFAIGTVLGLAIGLWLGACRPPPRRIFDPYIKATNAMPRVVLAPIFMVWFGLGIWSKVALGVTLVFFIVFFNVYQGVKEVSPVVLNNARMLGASTRSCCGTCTCLRRRPGYSRACTRRSAWPSSVRWWANTWVPRGAWATSSSRPKAPSTSTPCSRASWC